MLDIQNARVNTAGAYVCLEGFYLFAIGIRPHNGHIPVVRLGGHREKGETGWQCAAREVLEEASLQIEPLFAQTTYLADGDCLETGLEGIQWQRKIEQEPAPLLVVAYQHEDGTWLSLMYLAQADRLPKPSSEVKGILLLTQEEIHRLCQEPMTLEQYLGRGGRAILKAKFDTRLVLEPFAQLRLLSKILNMHEKDFHAAKDHI